MPADNQHAEVERVIAEALASAGWEGDSECALAAIRLALRDGRLTPEQVGSAVGLADPNFRAVYEQERIIEAMRPVIEAARENLAWCGPPTCVDINDPKPCPKCRLRAALATYDGGSRV